MINSIKTILSWKFITAFWKQPDSTNEKSNSSVNNRSNQSNESWIIKIVNKIKTFCKSLIAKAKMILKQIANKIRLLKAMKLKKKVDNASQSLYLDLKKFMMTKVNLKFFKKVYVRTVPSLLEQIDKSNINTVIQQSASKFADLIRNNQIISKENEFKKYLGMKPASLISNDKIYISDIKKFIDSAVNRLNFLSNSVNKLNEESKKLKSSGIDASTVRYGISTMYNLLSNVIVDYYKGALVLSEFFMKNRSDISKNNSDVNHGNKETVDVEHFKIVDDIIDELEKNVYGEIKDIIDKFEKEQLEREAEKAREAVTKMHNQWIEMNRAIGTKQIPTTTDAYNEDAFKKLNNIIERYIDRINDIFEKKIDNAKDYEEVELISNQHFKALELIDDIIDREASGKFTDHWIENFKYRKDLKFKNFGKLDQKFINAERDSQSGRRINEYPELYEKRLDIDYIRDLYTKGKWSTGDGIEAITLNHIADFINQSKYVDPSVRAKLRKNSIRSCNKIVVSIYKKYGRSPDESKMEKIDAKNLKRATEYLDKLKS